MAQQQSHAAETVRRRLNMAHLPLSFAGGCQHGSSCERPRILSIKMTLLLGDASLFLSTLLSKIFRDAFAPYLSKYSRRCAVPRSRLISSHSRASDAVPKRIIRMRSPSDLDIVAVALIARRCGEQIVKRLQNAHRKRTRKRRRRHSRTVPPRRASHEITLPPPARRSAAAGHNRGPNPGRWCRAPARPQVGTRSSGSRSAIRRCGGTACRCGRRR
jgi:hypothetical protein